MKGLANPLESVMLNAVLLIFISLALVVGVVSGYYTNLDVQSLFRGLVLTNVLLVGYMVLLRNAIAGILVYLYSLVFFNYYWRIVLPGIWPDIDLPRMMFVFVWLIFLLQLSLGQRQLLRGGAIGSLMLLVMAAIVMSMVVTRHWATRVFLNGYAIPFGMFAVSKSVFTKRRSTEKFIFWLAVPLALYFPVTAILEHYKVYGLLFPRYIGKTMVGDVQVNWGDRAMGTFIQPGYTGMVMDGIFVLALYSLFNARAAIARIYAVLLMAITPIGVFFTYTRSVYASLAAALVVLLLFSKKLRLVALVLLLAIALGVLGNWQNMKSTNREAGGVGEIGTVQSRVVVINASMQLFKENPLFGCGFDQFIKKAQPYVAQIRSTILGYREESVGEYVNQHNVFVSILTEVGLVGFIPFIALWILLLRLLIKARSARTSEYDSDFVAAVSAVVVAYLTTTMFLEPRWGEFMNVLPFILMGILAGGLERASLGRSSRVANGLRPLDKEYAT